MASLAVGSDSDSDSSNIDGVEMSYDQLAVLKQTDFNKGENSFNIELKEDMDGAKKGTYTNYNIPVNGMNLRSQEHVRRTVNFSPGYDSKFISEKSKKYTKQLHGFDENLIGDTVKITTAGWKPDDSDDSEDSDDSDDKEDEVWELKINDSGEPYFKKGKETESWENRRRVYREGWIPGKDDMEYYDSDEERDARSKGGGKRRKSKRKKTKKRKKRKRKKTRRKKRRTRKRKKRRKKSKSKRTHKR